MFHLIITIHGVNQTLKFPFLITFEQNPLSFEDMENLKSCHTTSLPNHLSCNYVSYIIEGHVEWVHKLCYVAILQSTQKVKIWFYFVHFFTFGKLGNKQIMLILRNTFLCKYYYLYRIIKHGQILHWRFSIIVQQSANMTNWLWVMRDFRHKTQSDDFTGNFLQCVTYNMLDLPMTRSHS